MKHENNVGMQKTGLKKVKQWKTYYLGKLFQDVSIRHLKPVYSAVPGYFSVSRHRKVKPTNVVPMSDFGEVLTGVRHLIRQSGRSKFDVKQINRAWNRFSLLRNLPDTQEIVYEPHVDHGGKLIMRPGESLITGKSLPKNGYIPIQTWASHLKSLHRNVRKKGFRKHVIIPAPGAYQQHPYKVKTTPIWIGPQFNLPSFKGILKEEYFNTIPIQEGNVVRRTWSGPKLSPYYVELVNRMRRFRSKLLEKTVVHAVDSEKKLRKRRFIARCTRKAIRVMQLFTKHGHDMRARLLEKIGPDKYKLIRRITRICRRRQTRFIQRRENLKFHARLKEKGKRRKLKRIRKRIARDRARANLPPRPPNLDSPYFRKPRKKRPVKLVYRIRPGKTSLYLLFDETKRVNLGKLRTRSLINNRRLKRTLNEKTTSARVKGNKRTKSANKTG